MSAWLADRVLAVHDLHRNRLVAAGIPAGKISVVLNSPDLKIFDPGAFRRTNGRAGMTLVCHGTVARRLGLDIAIKALELLGPEERAVRLMVIGRGDYLAEAKALVAAMKLEDRVSFIAPVPIEGLPALLAQADVGLVPNRPSAATHLMLPVKMLEYATLGLPILAARLQTMERYFGDGAVRFFEPGNPEALAAAIRELHRNPKCRYELAERASEVAETLSWKHQQDRYFDAIHSAAKPALSSNNESCGRDDAGSP